jgi:pimeloyl-ACP methyl ester carboxylesterase
MQRVQVSEVGLAYELRGTGAPLVMIHGAQGDQTMFSDLAGAFSAHFRVLTFDQRGSGLSDKPHTPYSIALLADDTAALMDAVGFSAAHIIGVSMGGTIAQELALRHPYKVRSWDAPPPADPARFVSAEAALPPPIRPSLSLQRNEVAPWRRRHLLTATSNNIQS